MIRAQLSVYNTYLLNVQAFQVARAASTNLTQKRSDILHKRTYIYTLGLFLVHLLLKAKKAIDFSFSGNPTTFIIRMPVTLKRTSCKVSVFWSLVPKAS